MTGDGEDGRMYVLLVLIHYCVYAVGFHPTEEPIWTKVDAIAEARWDEQRGALFSYGGNLVERK